MLRDNALHFSRADVLGDPLEGSYTRALNATRERLPVAPPEGRSAAELEAAFTHNSAVMRGFPSRVYVSCWHMGNHESMAMWRGYGDGPYGVAIRTTFGHLDDGLPTTPPDVEPLGSDIFIGRVHYLDYDSEVDQVPHDDNVYGPFICKSVVYRHESEVRAVCLPRFASLETKPRVMPVPIDLQQVVQQIVVSPLAEPWFAEVVESTCDRFGFTFPVVRSESLTLPIF